MTVRPDALIDHAAGCGMTVRPLHAHDDIGGDPACWLGRVCADCGALIEGPRGSACWRCGRMPAGEEEHGD